MEKVCELWKKVKRRMFCFFEWVKKEKERGVERVGREGKRGVGGRGLGGEWMVSRAGEEEWGGNGGGGCGKG
ncbi:hypothetical protein, partial [Siminovitchia fortis]|uniref:hypothetical protein n=1 Tax=Siminovitchia fortis TaxID=254758 RepID=UPI0036F301F5